MKRYILPILLCLSLGVVTTVAVAWGLEIWSWNPQMEVPITMDADHLPDFDTPDDWSDFSTRRLGEGFGIKTDAYHSPLDSATHWTIGKTSTGLPFSSMNWITISSQNIQDHPNVINQGIAVPSWLSPTQPSRHLPLALSIPGFIYNALIYGVFFLMCWEFSCEYCRYRRKCRGCCPKCAYDLRSDFESGCSECGWGRVG